MKKPGLIFKAAIVAFAAVFFLSCYTYDEIRLRKSVSLDDWPLQTTATGNNGKSPEKKRIIYINKYLAKVSRPAPLAEINGKAVEYALEGAFFEAERLFIEAAAEYPSSPVPFNNLGVIYEIFNMREKAAEFYLRACAIDPDNRYFRKNFLSFDD